MSTRTATPGSGAKRIETWLAWALTGLYVVLTTSGQTLQVLAGIPWDPVLGFSGLAILSVALGVWSVIGAIVVSRHPRNPIGWILCAVPVIAAMDDLAFGYAAYDLRAHPGSLPGADVMVVWTAVSGLPFVVVLLILLFLLFPDGRPLSPRWRLAAWLGFGAVAVAVPLDALRPGPLEHYPFFTNPIGVSGSVWAVLDPLQGIAILLAVLCLLTAVLSLILRLRRARGDERQQVKWLAYTAAFFPVGILLMFFRSTQITLGISWILQGVTITGLPIAIAFAIFKYRLYDIDVIINRTLVYAGLTGTLAVVYFVSVVLLEQVFRALTGQSSQLAIVASTLAIAALFNPLRRRIQNDIDRRFYRRKYDAQQVLAAFAETARDETDLDRLTDELIAVVEETMQPAHVSLWLRPATNDKLDRNNL